MQHALRARGPVAADLDPGARARGASTRDVPEIPRRRRDGARIEVRADRTPGPARVVRDLTAAGGVRFAERTRVDMETTLLAMAQGLVTGSIG